MPTIEKPSLPELQRWMRWVLTRPDGVEDALSAPKRLPKNWTRGQEPKRWLSVIGETADVSKSARLSIYGDGYFLRIVDCLGAIYESVKNVVGDHAFLHHLGREYLVKYPSVHRCIDNVGERMADFISHRSEGREFPFLADLARLEWAYHESFYADERPAFDFAALRSQPVERWESATFEVDPSVKLLDLAWAVDDVWRADGNLTEREAADVKRERTTVLVYRRPDAQVRVWTLQPAAFAMLAALRDGKTFGQALKAATRRNAATPDDVMTWFSEWAQNGVLRKVRFR